jgi:hypothetical protein
MTCGEHRPIYDRIKPRYWHLRGALLVIVSIAIHAMCAAPGTLTYEAIDASGPNGWYWVYALIGVLCIAWADVVVNDVMPCRFDLRFVKRWRYLIYIALCLGLTSICGVIALAVGWTVVLEFYGFLAIVSAWTALTDLMHYHQLRASDRRAKQEPSE